MNIQSSLIAKGAGVAASLIKNSKKSIPKKTPSSKTNSSTTESNSSNKTSNKGVDSKTKDKILNLATSDKEVMTLIEKQFSKADLSPLEQNELQYLFSRRQQISSLISNLARAAFDTANNIVRNLRG
jgi:hypothetical protein